MPKWSERPRDHRMALIGGMVGMLIAGVVAIVFASESGTLVRYFIMAAGLLLGLGAGKLAAGKA